MAPRFLYVDADGREVKVTSLDAFRALVGDGVISEDTLLYDALSRDWATARFHPVYRLAVEDISRSWNEDTDGSEDGFSASVSDLGLHPDSEAPDPTTAFLEEYERELRRAELEPGGRAPRISGLQRESMQPGIGGGTSDGEADDDSVDESSKTPPRKADVPPSIAGPVGRRDFAGSDSVADRRPPPEAGRSTGDRRESGRTRNDSSSGGPASTEDRRGATAGAAAQGPAPDRPTASEADAPAESDPAPFNRPASAPAELPRVMVHPRWSGEPIRQLVLFSAVVAIGGWGIAEAWATDPIPPVDEEVLVHEARVASDAYTAPGALRIKESAEAAFSDMTAGMQRIQAQLGVGAPPESWLSGEYLSDPESAPEAMAYWDRYDVLVDSLRAAEEDLFRAGFVTRLQRQGITGSVLSIRLARAMQDFTADRPRREVVYAAMENLVEEARALDTFLHENSDRIAFAGVRSGALSNDPATEAVPLDDQTRESLAEHLDRLFLAMDEVTGTDPDRRRDLTGNVMELLRGGS